MKPSPYLSTVSRSLALTALAAAAMAWAMPAGAQVTVFKQPPTPAELRAALLGNSRDAGAPALESGSRSTGIRTRGIVWDKPGAATAPPASAPAARVETATARIDPGEVARARPHAAAAAPADGAGGTGASLPISFDSGSSRVDRTSLPYIESLAAVLQSDASMKLVIEGHTDGYGNYNRNMVLSWDRALGVYRTLVENYGIEPSRLVPVGKGPSEPLPGTAATDPTNRRVQFRIEG